MKKNEFLEKLNNLGYKTQTQYREGQECTAAYSLLKADEKTVGMVATKESGVVYLFKDTPQEVAVLLTQYAYTPIEERKNGYTGTTENGGKYGLISYNETDSGVVLTFGKTTPNLTTDDAKAADTFIKSLENE